MSLQLLQPLNGWMSEWMKTTRKKKGSVYSLLIFLLFTLYLFPVGLQAQTCPCSIWSSSTTPANPAEADGNPVELGLKFRPVVNGYITGIRYYKSSSNTGTHIGNLWTAAGTNLAQAVFTAETSSGWQQVNFNSPVAVVAGTTYIASYHTNTGYYSADENYFTSSGVNTPVLQALQNGVDGPNGVYVYSSTSAFPASSFNSTNYYVDVIFVTTAPVDTTAPLIISTMPTNGSSGIALNADVSIMFNEGLDPATVNSNTIELRDALNQLVSSTITYNAPSRTIVMSPNSVLNYSSIYTTRVKGGNTGSVIKDLAGNALAADSIFTFTTTSPPPPPPTEGPGGPILVISSSSNPFSRYPVEILRAEGFNEFAALDISFVTAQVLANYDVVVLGEIPLSATNVSDLTNWVNAGGTLIAFKPDAQLATLMGVTPVAGNLTNAYLLVNTASSPGAGIVNQTIQFHGPANLYTLSGASSIATLYSNLTTATSNPAVTRRSVGSNGGQAILFSYDLARSVVYTRQGNPSWAGQKRDGTSGPVRSDDMFYPNWIDFNRIAVPQADEQQHLLSNLILQSNLHRKPLPRFWFLPKGLKAAVVMTGDDHAISGPSTANRFNQYISLSPDNSPTGVADWNAIRGSSYIFPGTQISNSEVLNFQAQGFEIGLHLNTNCSDWTQSSWQNFWNSQYSTLVGQLPGMNAQRTHRTHCIAWSDYATQPKVQLQNGVRLDVNYYYYPGSWLQDRPGLFTGSGIPMRFADVDGTLIDCYQVPTQLTDESGQTLATHISALLDSALGSPGYYGVFCANMHTDNVYSTSQPGSDAIVAAALARNVPVVSAKQMLDWLDGRNGSSFQNIQWNNNQLIFNIAAVAGSRNMKGMLPLYSVDGTLQSITYNGSPLSTNIQIIKGMAYVFFDATLGTGNYIATYLPAPPVTISNIIISPNSNGTALITWNTDQLSTSRVDYGTSSGTLNLNKSDLTQVTSHSITLTGLTQGQVYYLRVSSTNQFSNTAAIPAPPLVPLSFVVPLVPCAIDQSAANFSLGSVNTGAQVSQDSTGSVILKPNLIDEFSGSTLTASRWTSAVYNTGGTTVVSGGKVTVNGTHVYSNNSFAPGTTLEFVATFSSATFQSIGFSFDQPFNGTPWITIGEGPVADGNLYARGSDGSNVLLGANLLGSPHRYRIRWNTPANNFSFYVDENLVATSSLTISSNLFIQISDFLATGGSLAVDWIRATPYTSTGTFTSRVFDHGSSANWTAVNWYANTPAGTGVLISGRTGNTPTPDGSWTAFTPLTNGNNASLTGRYLQYNAVLNTSNTQFTPSLYRMSVGCTDANSVISITQQPSSQTSCSGNLVKFVSKASSGLALVVQWQVSPNGVNWSNIFGAVTDTLSLNLTGLENSNQYRAVWTNGAGSAVSNAATLTVYSVTGSVTGHTDVLCFGAASGTITTTGTGGLAPYTFSLDSGNTYISSGSFSGLRAGNYLVRIRDINGCIKDTPVVISQPELISPAIVNPPLACLEDANGTLTISATGGVSPFQYSINGGISYQSSGLFSNLTASAYPVRIKDANNCLRDTSVIVTVEKAVWTGSLSNDWQVAGNWSTGKVPGATTHVIIPAGTLNVCTVSQADAFVASIQVQSGATVNVTGNFKIFVQGKCLLLPN